MKKFKDYPYYVSEDGKFFREGKTYPLKEDVNERGYRRVTMCIQGKRVRVWVHRTVGELYLNNPNNLPFILHGDNDPSNNHYTNLRWGTHSENMAQCHKDGRCSNIIASDAAKEAKNKLTLERFQKLLGDRLLHVNFGWRTYISYICKGCGEHFRSRTDSSVFKRGGDCRSCGMK